MIASARHTPAKTGTITRYSATPLLAALVATILASVLYRANRAVLLSRSRCDGWTDATLSHQEDDPSAKLMQSGTKTHPSTPIASRPLVRNSSVSDRALGYPQRVGCRCAQPGRSSCQLGDCSRDITSTRFIFSQCNDRRPQRECKN